MDVSVYVSRIFDEYWRVAHECPKSALPELTSAERNTATKRGVTEEEYARIVLAQRLSADRLVERTAAFGTLLQRSIKAKGIAASVHKISLDDLRQRYQVEVQMDGKQVPLTIDGQLVRDLLERGSAEAEAGISRIIDLNLAQRVIA